MKHPVALVVELFDPVVRPTFCLQSVGPSGWGKSLADLYRYAAFISYASKDAKFARALHRQLERYVIPRKLGTFDLTGGGKKNRVYPVFRDREELPAGDLGTNLEAALRASSALIVVCSPNAALSPWVEKEIEYFISLGRADRVFAIVADTAPISIDGKDATRISFPRPFRPEDGGSLEPVAADARKGKDGFRNAWLKVIAGLIQANAGDLQDRDERRRRTNRLIAGSGIAAISASAAFAAWAMVLPYEAYAKDYTRVFGVWTPVDPVSSAIASRREASYRFIRRGALGPTVSVEWINGAGYCPESSGGIRSLTGDAFNFECNNARACSVRLTYAGGALSGEEILDQFGNALEQIKYSSGGVQAIREEAVVGCSRVDNGIKFVTIDRASAGPNEGQDIRLQFFAAPGEHAPSLSYAYGFRYEYDAKRRRVRTIALSKTGVPKITSQGWAIAEALRDHNGEVTEWTWRDEAGKISLNIDGMARQTVKRDEVGNAIEVSNFDANDDPVANKEGIQTWRSRFDAAGNEIRTEYLGADGAATVNADGAARVDLLYDIRGYLSKARYFDAAGKPSPSASNGCYSIDYLRSDSGLQYGFRCFGPIGEPIPRKEGYHLWLTDTDSFGNTTLEAYYGTNDEPVLGRQGAHIVKHDWQSSSPGSPPNRRIRGVFLGTELEPVVSSVNKYHMVANSFDPKGNWIAQHHIGIDGAPVADARGAFAYALEYDERGKQLAQTSLGPNDEEIDVPGRTYVLKRDEFGRETERAYFRPGREPALFNGIWRYTTKYDSVGRIIQNASFGIDDEPLPAGLAIEQREYDPWGRTSRILYKDESGRLSPGPEGAAILEYRRDIRGHITDLVYLGPDRQPVLGQRGWSRQTRSIDTFGRIVSGRYLGPAGEPVEIQTGEHGWRSTYDARGNQIEFAYLGLDGQPKVLGGRGEAAIFRYDYDDRDRQVRQLFFDALGNPATDADGRFGLKFEFDQRGYSKTQVNLGRDGEPAPDEYGALRFEFDRSPTGQTVEERIFGADGLPRSESYFRLVSQRDRLGNETEIRLYDFNNKLVKSASTGRAIVKSSYNALGKLIVEEAFGIEEEPVDRTDFGWHRKEIQYSDSGAWISEICSRVDESVVPCK